MTLTRVSPHEYTIDTPGFPEHLFSAASQQYLALPGAVRYAQQRNSVLQSAAEAVAFRLAAQRADLADNYQVTRTAELYFKDNDTFAVAFDDDPAENILLSRAQQGYDAHKTTNKWLVPKDDPLIRAALARAATTRRIVPLAEKVALATTAWNSASGHKTNMLLRATIGDLAEPYAEFLSYNNRHTGYEYCLDPRTLQQLGVDEEQVEVRCVGIGSSDNNINLYAGGRCVDAGRARGVRSVAKPTD